MARRYNRDKLGRFAPKGTGATARGGRLKTKSGKRRETQTIKSSKGVAGTIGKPKGLKPGTIKPKPSQLSSQQKRDIKLQQIEASRSASRNSARMGNVGNTPAQEAAYAKAAKADRARANALGKKLEGQSAPPTVFARSSRIKGEEIGGKYKGKGKTSLYGKDLAKTSAARPGSTVRKPAGLKPGALSPKPAAKPAAKRLQAKVAAKRAARRADRAEANIPMRGSRGRRLDAEISRNVKQQKAAKRAAGKARNRQFKSDQSRAKALRARYGDQLAKDFAAKSGKKVSEVKAAIKGMAPSQQVKLLTKAGRQQRAQANLARTADTRNKPGSTMIRRPSQKTIKSNLRAEKALEFYKDPKKALRSVNKKRAGFRLPRGMR